MRRILLAWLVAGCLLGCSDDDCVDRDGDGFGLDCERGPDCDDGDPRQGGSCDAGVADCDAVPENEGCPCQAGEIADCYPAPVETNGVGECRSGTLTCPRGFFSECMGLVVPTGEACNGKDDDCDGTIDEGVRSPCGGCNDACIGGVWGPPVSPFVADGDLVVTAEGELTLRRDERVTNTLWVPNTEEGTVSKIDTDAVREVARYRTAGTHPTRVAVDRAGDVWILDTPTGERGVLTKIAGEQARCRDAISGTIQTSTSPKNVLELGADDCVLLSLPIGSVADQPRSLAVDGARDPDGDLAGNVWVGMAGSHEVVALEGTSGEVFARVELPKVSPHVAAFDEWGTLWIVDADGKLVSVDTAQAPPAVTVREVDRPCFALDGLSIGPQGTLLLTGFSCESLLAFDPVSERFDVAMTTDFLTPRGVVIDGDHGWVAFTSGQLGRVDRSPLGIDDVYELEHDGRVPYESIAVSRDGRGRVWVVSGMGGQAGRGLVSVFDPVSESVIDQLSVGVGPRAYGDMTGMSIGGELASAGTASHVFRGCEVASQSTSGATVTTEWIRLHVDARTSLDSSIELHARWAEREEDLDGATFLPVGVLPERTSPLSVSFPRGGVVEVRAQLRAGGAYGAPRLRQIGLEWACPGPE